MPASAMPGNRLSTKAIVPRPSHNSKSGLLSWVFQERILDQ